MWWFTQSEERTMARRQRERQVLAQRLAREGGIPALARDNTVLVAKALTIAEADEAYFERLYGEPMPPALRIAVHLEVDIWTLIKNTLNTEERRLLPRRLDHLQKILALEREMLHTPLTIRYQNTLARIATQVRDGQ